MDDVVLKIRESEAKELALYAKKFRFSEHLWKYEDDLLPDKYDHNYFEYDGLFSEEERDAAQKYQDEKGADFLKFMGRTQLPKELVGEEGEGLTMALRSNDTSTWKSNAKLTFGKPTLVDVVAMEVKEFGPYAGEDFSRRNAQRLYEKETFFGAFLDGTLVGYCLPFVTETCVGIDDMIVGEAWRKQYICTSLLKKVVDENPAKLIYLHADAEDTPKDLYARLGFEVVDREYDYLKIKKEN